MMNIAKMMSQAKKMQDDMKTLQDKMKTTEVSDTLSGIAVTLYGNGIVKSITIDKDLVNPDDKDTLEDLLVAALNKTREKMEKMVADETQKIMGGMQLPPGMQLPF